MHRVLPGREMEGSELHAEATKSFRGLMEGITTYLFAESRAVV
jgi:hypothetical protein